MRRLEREGAEAIAAAFARLHRKLFRGVTADNVTSELPTRLSDPKYTQDLSDTIAANVRKWAQAGVDHGRETIERHILGVKTHEAGHYDPPGRAPNVDPFEVDWQGVNTEAQAWATDYAGQLVGDILEQTRRRVGQEIAAFAENGETINQLADRLSPVKNAKGSPFGPVRAQMIAITEVTRSYAAANALSWESSGVVEGKEWRTNNDELVCKICGPMDGRVAELGKPFDGSFSGDYPPAHPRCRCWIVPVNIINTEAVENERREAAIQREIAEEIATIEKFGFKDPLEDILPPEGRAPRGLGKDWQARRTIVKKVATQRNYLAKARAQVASWTGLSDPQARAKFDRAKDRMIRLDKAVNTMLEVATDPYSDDFVTKKEVIEAIIEHTKAEEAILRYERGASRQAGRS